MTVVENRDFPCVGRRNDADYISIPGRRERGGAWKPNTARRPVELPLQRQNFNSEKVDD